MPPRLAILDLDGTLADSRAVMFAALADAARRFGFREIDAEEAEELRGQDTRAILRALGVGLWQVPRIATHIKHLASREPPPKLFPGAEAMLARLQQGGITLALVTSNTETNARRMLGADSAARIAHWACDAALFGKAARFREVLGRAAQPRAAAIAIGDELRDIAAARAIGLAVGAVAWGYALPAALQAANPDVLFHSMDEIPPWFGL